MKSIITKKTAGIILIVTLALLTIFHLLVVLGIFPYDIVWGGNADETSIVQLELVSAFITAVLLIVAVIRAGYIQHQGLQRVSRILIWIMVAYFAFMIFGNAFAETNTEKVVFIPVSIILFLTSLRLAMKD